MSIEKELEVKEKAIEFDCSKSTLSTTTTLYPLEESNPFFNPTRRLLINAHGIGVLRFPTPPRELDIPIQTEDGKLVYLSKREKRSSGNCMLSHVKLGDVVQTEYFFGPNRDPVLYLLDDEDGGGQREVKTKGKWTSRAMEFRVLGGESLEWRYTAEELCNGGQVNLLVLSRVDSKADKENGNVIAKLIRSDETRTPGSAKCSAGNGGELLIDEEALGSLDEGLVVASCLVMLKREIDRRRALQIAMIGAVVT
ncbi:hypothetical protein PHISCL_02519 [Aspergillus sclerotialis]|uniref:Uncharacterized protein n=1 Tax=Aspergillus sclerotialis TaxID=2070753 RepID=A0A3A2ZS17_9EURO|nr:hypothetical protein PHISCL_02519 [Aspergillus sclerotialis]